MKFALALTMCFLASGLKGDGNNECPASKSFRRTVHYLCHGYSDGQANNVTAVAGFLACAQEATNYNITSGVNACLQYFPDAKETVDLDKARTFICSMHHNETAMPLFNCLIDAYEHQSACNLTGCQARMYVVDDLNYNILKCYQEVYGRFPNKFNCDD